MRYWTLLIGALLAGCSSWPLPVKDNATAFPSPLHFGEIDTIEHITESFKKHYLGYLEDAKKKRLNEQLSSYTSFGSSTIAVPGGIAPWIASVS